MNSTTVTPLETIANVHQTTTRRQIRGSTLLLIGRVLSMGVNFAAQVLIVRYLSKTDYGAFAYALSLVTLGESIATFGLDRAITRFVPIYHEQRDYAKLFGTLGMVVSTILSFGLAMILLLYSLQGLIAQAWINDHQALTLLLILIFLAPVQALDNLILGLLATFASPRSIFFRRHILGPGLKFAVVLLLILGGQPVFFLAGGYLAAGVLGVGLYGFILLRILQQQGVLAHFHLKALTLPWREVLAFTLPLMTSDLVYILMNSSDAVLLERFSGTAAVAAFRAVQPAAGLNQLLLSSFTLLFTPAAARLFARNDRAGINHLYWQTALWMAILAFPIFAVTFSLAQPLTLLLYGQRYADSAVILALLSLGYYFNTALGFNGLTLKVYGKVRYVVVINLLAAAANVSINLVLIPRYGALGAAVGTSGTLLIYNILKQAGLRLGTGISLFERRYWSVYGLIALGVVGLLLIQVLLSPPILISFGLAAIVSLAVVGLNRRALDVGQMFPEVLRFPLVRWLLGH
jgi:O-antigen/teichoic acid export membrane protein